MDEVRISKKTHTETVLLIVLTALLLLTLAVPIFLLRNTGEEKDPEDVPAWPTCAPNPLAPDAFTYDENGYLITAAQTALPGIDVSSHQGQIDWAQVKDAGFRFVMIRVGGRYFGEDSELYTDDLAQENYRGAKEAGLLVGAYFFSQATNVRQAQEEAQFALSLTENWEMDLPLVCDWESVRDTYPTGQVDRKTLTACLDAFCRCVEAAGRDAMVYFNPSTAGNRFFPEKLSRYGGWLAMYNSRMEYPYEVTMWQYTDAGCVPGISGGTDLDLYFPESGKTAGKIAPETDAKS